MPKIYCGLKNDKYGGMTPIGIIIRDAWVFGILPENETCDNWSLGQLQVIQERTREAWDKYGCLASNLPEELRQRHAEIHNRAIEEARALGWEPNMRDDD